MFRRSLDSSRRSASVVLSIVVLLFSLVFLLSLIVTSMEVTRHASRNTPTIHPR